MKVILRFLGAIMISSVSLTSINVHSKILAWNPPQVDTEFARLLGWYSDNNTPKIEQKLQYNAQINMYEISINKKIITETNFKTQLLIANGNDFTAKNLQTTNLLRQLGFTSGGVGTIYSNQDVANISNLTAIIDNVNHGKITTSSLDYQIARGTMEVSVKLNNKTLHTYHLDTLNNNNLNIPQLASQLVNSNTIALTKICGFTVNALTSNCTLNLNSNDKQNQWTALLNFLSATPSLTWTDNSMSVIETFTTAPVWLQVSFGKIIVVNAFYCGNPQ
ncbi:hypothetical protein [Spiroplasma endosymbiont of Virgichneumon dumeticola]|uniref:hypothetical protein n=1 Tax=Spiroplasma endosymbiont of Virgichneumon dumeticola TaxID=3139323 RepID=UPI0035C91A99